MLTERASKTSTYFASVDLWFHLYIQCPFQGQPFWDVPIMIIMRHFFGWLCEGVFPLIYFFCSVFRSELASRSPVSCMVSMFFPVGIISRNQESSTEPLTPAPLETCIVTFLMQETLCWDRAIQRYASQCRLSFGIQGRWVMKANQLYL